MKVKLIILIFALFFITGCTANYDVVINDDLTVSENIEIIGDSRFKVDGNYTIDSMYNTLKETYTELYENSDLENVSKFVKDGNMSISITNSYNDLDSFASSFVIKKIYSKGLDINKKQNIVGISSDNQLDNFWLFVDGMEEDPLITNLQVKIKVPFVVTKNNADKVDAKNNIFVWNYNYNDYSKKINLEFDKNRKFSSGIDFLKIFKYVGLVVVLVGIGLVCFKFIKNKSNKKNKI